MKCNSMMQIMTMSHVHSIIEYNHALTLDLNENSQPINLINIKLKVLNNEMAKHPHSCIENRHKDTSIPYKSYLT